ncbi:AAA family ATPase [Actinorugispora endophytica]|uniref:Pilus assembly protein CpaE n=1 Tax=Actinorugispora endophytica TaxID=1605990 RepID=A0A4R6USL9_9ACTN|nr:AAA family ATPase [Actinorugispora endophytica]TDQ49256.1 pilus assembly protein CpaE [Actinorugispora endophytica]
MSTYQVLIGAPSDELENALTARFEELAEAEVVSVHRSSREVSDTVGKLPHLDVVLIHEDLGPLPVLDLVRDISRNHPQLAVILIAHEIDPDTFTSAMEAGARGLLQADATIEQLGARVATAAEWSRTLRRHLEAASLDLPVSGRRGQIITLTGAKGGVGTTTTAIHLSRVAAKAGRVVCLVDLDLQSGDIPGYYDLKHRRSIVDLVDAADDISAAMLADTLYVHNDGPHILLAPEHGEHGEDVTARAARQILGALRSRYDLVVVDCGSSITDSTAVAVELSDTAIVLVNPDLPALRGAQRLIAMWERLQIRDAKNVTALLMRHSRRNEIQPDFARKLLGTDMLRTAVPAAYRALEEASNTGIPGKLTDEGLLRAFGRLAGELGMLSVPDDESGPSTDEAAEAMMAQTRRSRGNRGDSGASIVEFAALLPFLGLALLLTWQIVLVGLTGMYASHAANEGARQASLTPNDPELILEEATRRVRAPWDEEDAFTLEQVVEQGQEYVQVTIAMPAVLPGVESPWDISSRSLVLRER